MSADPTDFLRQQKVRTISPVLFQIYRLTKKFVVLRCDFVKANQIRDPIQIRGVLSLKSLHTFSTISKKKQT